MRNEKGFSLIELLLVVAVILIITAIAVPNFLRSRMRAHEANTVAALRVIVTGAIAYSTSYPTLGYPAQLSNLGGANPCTPAPSQACLVDDSLAQGLKDGYRFQLTGDGLTPSYSFTLTATPQVVGSSGQNMYCTDQTAVVHYDSTGAGCTSANPAL